MNCAYVSLLSTDSYAPGVLALHHSLRRAGTRHPFVLLVTPAISTDVRELLERHGLDIRLSDPDPDGAEAEHAAGRRRLLQLEHTPAAVQPARWHRAWAKLHIFNLTQYDKLVYLDADMLVNRNVDELFDRPHMSAVNAGGLLPERASWVTFNAGLLVIEPSAELFSDMMHRLAQPESSFANDQVFLHAYYHDWPQRVDLHLDHRYNMFDICIDRYHELFGYGLDDVRVIHYIGTKPWDEPGALARWKQRAVLRARRLLKKDVEVTTGPVREAAIRVWLACYDELMAAQHDSA